MTKNHHRDLTPVLPKKERKNFFLLITFLLLLAASFASLVGTFMGQQYYGCELIDGINRASPLILDDATHLVIAGITLSLSLLLSIVGAYKKNYYMLGSAGCLLLITSHLCFIFGAPYFEIHLIFLLIFCAFFLLIPAINARICQLGAPQTANRRLTFASLFFIPVLLAFVGLFYLLGHLTSIKLHVFLQVFSAILCFFTLLLWIKSIRKKIWLNTSPEEAIGTQSWRSFFHAISLQLNHLIILIILFYSWICVFEKMDSGHAIFFISSLLLGIIFASYRIKNTRIAQILQTVVIFFSCISPLIFIAFFIGLINAYTISASILTTLISIFAFFAPLCLARCRNILLMSPCPKNNNWVHLFLLLNFLVAFFFGIAYAFGVVAHAKFIG